MGSSPATIRVLHVEDDSDFAALAADFLERENELLSVETALSGGEGLDRISQTSFDCIVSDYDMPGMNGIEFLEAVRDRDLDIPFILFTGKGSEEVASDAISAGVSDYLQKGTGSERYSLLANRIDNLVSQDRAETQLETRALQRERVAELGQLALDGASIDTLFNRAVSAIAETLGTEYAKVLEYRPDEDDLLLRAGVGWRDSLVGEATIGTGAASPAGLTLRSEEPIVVEDLRAEGRFDDPALLVEHDVVSGISVIIGPSSDPWGIVGTYTVEPAEFSEDDVMFVQSVANRLAAAIERIETEQRLRETRSWYQTILQHLSDYVIVVDASAEISYASPAIERVTGYQPSEVVGTEAFEYVHPDDLEVAANAFSETISEPDREISVEYRTIGKDGSTHWIEVRGSNYLDDPEIEGVLVSVRDITDRKERERLLKETKSSYEALIQASPVPIWVQGMDEIYYANEAAAELHGVDDAESLVGRSSLSFVPDEELDRTRRRNQRILDEDEPVEQQRGTVETESGETREAIFAAAPFRYRGEPAIVAVAKEVRAEESVV